MSVTRINDDFRARLNRTRMSTESEAVPDLTGITVGPCQIRSRLPVCSGEADIYLASWDGGGGEGGSQEYVLKLYRRKGSLDPKVVAKLKDLRSPWVAPVLLTGEYEGHQYAVRPYYPGPNLGEVLRSGECFSPDELRKLIIPSVNEGLRAIHELGILHRDLKPANLIPDPEGEHILLTDFGISADSGGQTLVVGSGSLTPGYAAPEVVHGVFSLSSDYFAFGITVYELLTGHTPFAGSAASEEELSRLTMISTISFPEDFPPDLRDLVLGLTYRDISGRHDRDNPNRRWGYEEVQCWLEGKPRPVPGAAGASPGRTMETLPYTFMGIRHTSVPELCRSLLLHPEAGLKELGRGILSYHFSLLDPEMGQLCRQAAERLESSPDGGDPGIVCELAYRLAPELRMLCAGGEEFGSLEEFGSRAVDAALALRLAGGEDGSGSGGADPGKDREIFLAAHAFAAGSLGDFYAREVLGDPDLAELLQQIRSQAAALGCGRNETVLLFGYAVSGNSRMAAGGRIYESPADFARVMDELASRDPGAFLKFTGEIREELAFYVRAFGGKECAAAVQGVLDRYSRAEFGDGDYFFLDGGDMIRSIDALPSDRRGYVVRDLLLRYRDALKSVCRQVWIRDWCRELEERMAQSVMLGDRLFPSREDLASFLEEMLAGIREQPGYFRDFVGFHEREIRELMRHGDLKDLLERVLRAAGDVVSLDYLTFPSSEDAAGYLRDLTAGERDRPGRIRDFVTVHRRALEALSGNPVLGPEIRGLMDLASRRAEPGTISIAGTRYPELLLGETMRFGTFRQSRSGSPEPIEWLVVRQESGMILLLSCRGLETASFHSRDEAVDWEHCDLRRWLNSSFLTAAFSPGERARIRHSVLQNPGNREKGIPGGSVTEDQIFCLSLEEIRDLGLKNAQRICQGTDLAVSRGCRVGVSGGSFWWLRSPGGLENKAAGVSENGAVSPGGNAVSYPFALVRPALWICRDPDQP